MNTMKTSLRRAVGLMRGWMTAAVVAAVALAAAGGAQAANDVLYWDANGSTSGTGGAGNWDTNSSLWRLNSTGGTLQAWTNAGSANGIYDANLGGTAGTVTNTVPITLRNLTFVTGGYVLINSAPANALNFSGAAVSISNAVNGTTSIYAPIKTDAGSVLTIYAQTVTSAGIRLYASNSIGGSVVITGNGGIVYLNNANALAGATGVTVQNLGTLQLSGGVTISGVNATISGRTTPTINGSALQGYGITGWSGNVLLAADASIGQRGGTGNPLFTISGAVSGGYALYINNENGSWGSGIVKLSGTNSYTGQTYVNGTSVPGLAGLSISTNANLGDETIGAALNLTNAVLYTTATMALDQNGANKRNVVLAGNSVNFFNVASGTTLTIRGIVSGTGGFTKAGAGLLAFTGDNTYSDLTFVTAGTLALGNTNAVKNSTLDMGLAGSQQVTLTVPGTNAYNLGGLRGTNNLALGANTLVIGSNNSTNTYWGTLSGLGGGLVKTGTGVMTLSGTNSYTGATVALAGVLELTRTNALSSATALDIRSGAEVKLSFTGTNVVYSLTVNGVTKSRGVFAAGSVPGLTGTVGAYLQTLQPSPRGTMIQIF